MARRKIRLEEIRGSFVRESRGDERIFECRKCGGSNLYVNARTGKWICFKCKVAGRERSGLSLSDVPSLARASDFNVTAELETLRRPFSAEAVHNLEARQIPEWLAKRCRMISDDTGGVGVILSLHDEPVGFQIYNPASEVRYRTHGIRGLWYPEMLVPRYIPKVPVLLEGLFDALSLLKLFDTNPLDTHSGVPVPILTAGNEVSEEQFTDFIRLVSSWRSVAGVLVAFDNDQLTPILRLKERISPFHRVVNAMPRIDGVKDWDQAVTLFPRKARKELEGYLRRLSR